MPNPIPTNPSTEDLSISVSDNLENNISAIDSLSSMSATSAELDKTRDIGNALDDMHLVMSRINEPTPIDATLVMAASNIAVSGTDIPASKFIPGMENYRSNVFTKVGLESIADRICMILKYFLQNTLEQSKEQSAYFRKRNQTVFQYQHLLNELRVAFPLPDKKEDDIPRTVNAEMAQRDINILDSILGRVQTQGDLLNQTRLVTRHLTALTKLFIAVRESNETSIRACIPADKIRNPVDAINFIKASNKLLHKDLVALWNNVLLPSEMVKSGTEGATTVSSIPLPGMVKLNVALAQEVVTEDFTMEQFLNRSNVIRSFAFVEEYLSPESTTSEDKEEFQLGAVTNAGIRDLIFTAEMFVGDANRYMQAIASIVEMTSAISEQNKELIGTCFDTLKASNLDPSVEAEYRQYVQTYVGDIENLYKTTTAMTVGLAEYFVYYLGALVGLLHAIPSFVPEGTYNNVKPQRLM